MEKQGGVKGSILVFIVLICGVNSNPLPQGGTTIQAGEPSHFQVDDKSAEIEVNANPAGVKVNAKPASLQVVAKPGTPAIPVFHPAIHVAPHYVAPPIIHREPAPFFHGYHHCPYCHYGLSHNWFYSGLRRDKLSKPEAMVRGVPRKLRKKSFYPGLPRRTLQGQPYKNIKFRKNNLPSIPHGLKYDKDGNIKSRNDKSDIPKPGRDKGKSTKSRKRQFIQGVPQLYQPQGLSSLGAYGYGVPPQYPAVSPYAALDRSSYLQRAPLARSLLSAYGQAPSNNILGYLSGYGTSGASPALGTLGSSFGISPLSAYWQPTPSNGLAALSAYGQNPSSSGIAALYEAQRSGIRPLSSLGQASASQALNSFISSPSSFSNGYSRSPVSGRYSSLAGYPSSNSLNTASSLYSSLLGLRPLGYGSGLVGYEKSLMQSPLAQLYAAQTALATLGGLQSAGASKYSQLQGTSPYMSLPYMGLGYRGPLVSRSKVPGSKNTKQKTSHQSKKSQVRNKEIDKRTKRAKRQALFPQDVDDGGYDLNEALQDELVNQYKRQLVFGRSLQSSNPLAGFGDRQTLQLPLQSLEPALTSTQQSTNPLLQQLALASLNANYISPIESLRERSPLLSSRMMTSSQLPFAQSRLPLRQLPLATSQLTSPIMSSQLPLSSSQLPMTSSPLTRGLFGQRDSLSNPRQFNPVTYPEYYRSPLEYDTPHYQRKYGRHPLYRRRLHRLRDYDDDDPEPYWAEPYGRETVTVGGSYPRKEVPNDNGETLVDFDNLGFGPITVEAKTAEGVKKSLGEDNRSRIAKPQNTMRNRHTIPRAPAPITHANRMKEPGAWFNNK